MNPKSADMKRAIGVNRRANSTIWQWCIKPPKDLQEHYKGQWAHRCSLDTADLLEANTKAAQLRLEWLQRFADLRKVLNPVPVAVITSELGATLGARIRHMVLSGDDARRDSPALNAVWIVMAEAHNERKTGKAVPDAQSLAAGVAAQSALEGLTPEQFELAASVNEEVSTRLGRALAARNLAAVQTLADTVARQIGLLIDWKTPEAHPVLLECLKSARGAFSSVLLRDQGLDIETPALPSEAAAPAKAAEAKPKTLRDVYDRWLKSGDTERAQDTKDACRRALELFEGFAPSSTLQSITRAQGDEFRAHLRGLPGTSKTARDRLTWVKSLLKYSCDTLEWIPKHPWVGLDIKATTTNKRRPWATSELLLLFKAPLHKAYELPKHWRAGKDAAYWIPLLGLFTGARLGELCQLRTEDVQTVDDIPILVLTDSGEDQRIKTEAGRRSVPIHSELIRLGFLEYVKAIKATGSDSLWPSLRLREGKPSGYYSAWFAAHRKAQGVKDMYPDFHCFRHTVRPLMRRAGFSEQTMDRITGHDSGGSVGTVVYDHFTLVELQKAVEAIQHPGLKLPLVSPYGAAPG
jgi:integrase